MSVLTLSDISKRFGNTIALNDISLQVDSGEFICLLGESGCGKTTLLRIIAGLSTSDQGSIQLGDRDLSDVPCHKRNIGMVFQSLALFQHLNVGRNVAYGLRMQGATSEVMGARVNELLNIVGLKGYTSRSVSSLSGGQRQRVAIARALALKPKLFLMDEPFSALDAVLRDHLQQEVKNLQQTLGITTIFVTHDQREAMALADRIVILNAGNVEQIGTPEAIYQQPCSRFVAEFIGSNNVLDVDIDSKAIRYQQFDLGETQTVTQNLAGTQTLAIRPESILLTPASNTSTTPHSLPGRVVKQRLVGALIEREIDVNGHLFKQTDFQNSRSNISTGDEVNLSWDWAQIWVIPQ